MADSEMRDRFNSLYDFLLQNKYVKSRRNFANLIGIHPQMMTDYKTIDPSKVTISKLLALVFDDGKRVNPQFLYGTSDRYLLDSEKRDDSPDSPKEEGILTIIGKLENSQGMKEEDKILLEKLKTHILALQQELIAFYKSTY